jgi:hypothetical protein
VVLDSPPADGRSIIAPRVRASHDAALLLDGCCSGVMPRSLLTSCRAPPHRRDTALRRVLMAGGCRSPTAQAHDRSMHDPRTHDPDVETSRIDTPTMHIFPCTRMHVGNDDDRYIHSCTQLGMCCKATGAAGSQPSHHQAVLVVQHPWMRRPCRRQKPACQLLDGIQGGPHPRAQSCRTGPSR